MTHHTECLPGIRRPSRWGAVWLSFRTNWTIWPFPIVLGLFIGTAAFSIWTDYFVYDTLSSPTVPRPEPAGALQNSSATVEVQDGVGHLVEKQVVQPDLDWAKLKSLSVFADAARCEQLWTPGAIPHLESLTLSGSINDQQLMDLSKLYDLKALTLLDFQFTQSGWRALCRETRLEYLELTDIYMPETTLPSGVKPGFPDKIKDQISLDWPPNLRTLYYEDMRGTTLERLDEWQVLPHLENLSVHLRVQDDQQADELIEVLRSFPSLKKLFVLPFDQRIPDYKSLFQDSLRRLQHAARRAGRFSVKIHAGNEFRASWQTVQNVPGRVQRAGTILGLELLVVLILTMQMSAVFVTTCSVLTPGFVRANIVPVVVTLLVTAIVSFGLLLLADCSVVAAFGLCGAAVFGLASTVKLLCRLQGTSGLLWGGLNHFTVLIATVYVPLGGYIFVATRYASEVDRFLDGQYPWLALMLCAGSVWGAFDLIAWHIGLRRNLETLGLAHLTLTMFTIKGLEKWAAGANAALTRSGQRRNWSLRIAEWVATFGDAQLDAQLERIGGPIQHRSLALWRIGNGTSKGLKWGRTFLGALLAVFPVFLRQAGSPPNFRWENVMLFSITPMTVFFFLIYYIRFWRRLPMQELELLRAASRRDWMRTWFLGMAIEAALVLVIVVVNAFVWLWSDPLGGWTTSDGFLLAILYLGIAGILFAFVMLLLSYGQSQGIQAVIVGGLHLGVMLPMPLLLFLTPILKETYRGLPSPANSLTVVVPYFAALYATAALTLWVAWRRWKYWEVGAVG